MTPKAYYQNALSTGQIQPDAQQKMVIEKLDNIFHALTTRAKKKKWLLLKRKNNPVKGLYLWGNVGIGKTFMMDCFYHCLDIPKMRLHFHQFMQRIHEELKLITGTKNPLVVIAKKISQEATVICFDEFFVTNIADAMILGELFANLFQYNVTLVTSSNVPPDLLYKDGLQRERFLPAIASLKKYTDIYHLHSDVDYRRQTIHRAGVYYTPLDEGALHNMENAFIHFSNGIDPAYDPIVIYDRPIAVIKRAGPVVWFDFDTICKRGRSQNDYLEITKQFHTVLIQNLRVIQEYEHDVILLFIYLVDILYDAHCRLIISADVPMEQLFTVGKIHHPCQRTLSRLIEMQSEAYIYPEIDNKAITQL